MSSVEQTSTNGMSLKFPPMTSVPSTDKTNLVETLLATITGYVQVQNTAAPIMYTVPVPNLAVNQQQAEITQIAPEPLSATPTLQETLNIMMSKMTQIEDTMAQMQANVLEPNLNYFQLLNLSLNLAFPSAAETIPNSFHLSKTRLPSFSSYLTHHPVRW